MAEVELRDLEKRYSEEAFAVKGISFRAKDGEFVVLVGPSGCGKSTTLRMIAGLEDATSGQIVIGGKVVNDIEPKDRDIAMVFQNYALYPHMTVAENMAFPLKMRKVERSLITKQVEEAAQVLSIGHLLNRKPKELSGGERQRVAVGRAIVRKPMVFLFDEPLSNLDAALRTQMRAELKRLQRRLGATMIYVTHDQVEAMTMGDKIAVMNKGLLEQYGTPSEIYEHPASVFVARFLGSPAMNLLRGALVGRNGRSIFTAGEFTLPVRDQGPTEEIYLGVRPEKIKLAEDQASTGPGFLTGKLILIEPVGSLTHFYLEVPQALGGVVVASVHNGEASATAAATYALGSTVTIELPESAAQFFDVASERRIETR